jgi:hypothetical protein
MTLGASWSGQFLCGVIALSFGIVGGVVSLIYSHKWQRLGKIEVALLDFAITIALTALYLLSIEIGGKGQANWYSILLFLLGIYLSNNSLKKFASFCARRTCGKFLKK